MRKFDISSALGDVNTHLVGEAIPGSARIKDWRRTKITTIAACACLALVLGVMTVIWAAGTGGDGTVSTPMQPAASGVDYGASATPLSQLDNESILAFAKNDPIEHSESEILGPYTRSYDMISERLTPDIRAVEDLDSAFCDAVREAALSAELAGFEDDAFLNDTEGVETVVSILRRCESEYGVPEQIVARLLDDVVLDYYIANADALGYDRDALEALHKNVFEIDRVTRTVEIEYFDMSMTIEYTMINGSPASAEITDCNELAKEGGCEISKYDDGTIITSDLRPNVIYVYMASNRFDDEIYEIPCIFAVDLEKGRSVDFLAPVREMEFVTWGVDFYGDGTAMIRSGTKCYIVDAFEDRYGLMFELPEEYIDGQYASSVVGRCSDPYSNYADTYTIEIYNTKVNEDTGVTETDEVLFSASCNLSDVEWIYRTVPTDIITDTAEPEA